MHFVTWKLYLHTSSLPYKFQLSVHWTSNLQAHIDQLWTNNVVVMVKASKDYVGGIRLSTFQELLSNIGKERNKTHKFYTK